MDKVRDALKVMWHEIQSEEGANAWITIKDFLDKHIERKYQPHSIEAFIFEYDDDFIAHSTPDRLVKYIKDNALDIDTSVLEKCIVDRNREMEISDRLCNIMYQYERGEEEYVKETDLLIDEANSLYDSIANVMKEEVLRIRETIKNIR
jgi:hypothetical protein